MHPAEASRIDNESGVSCEAFTWRTLTKSGQSNDLGRFNDATLPVLRCARQGMISAIRRIDFFRVKRNSERYNG